MEDGCSTVKELMNILLSNCDEEDMLMKNWNTVRENLNKINKMDEF